MKRKVNRKFTAFKAAYYNSSPIVEGRAISFPELGCDDLEFYIYHNPVSNVWNINEVSSGWKVSGGSTITEAVSQFSAYLQRHGGVETLRKLVYEAQKVS